MSVKAAEGVDTPWMTMAEVMAYARAGRTEILDALASEELRGYRRGSAGKWRIHRDDVDAWLRGLPPVAEPTPITGRRSA